LYLSPSSQVRRKPAPKTHHGNNGGVGVAHSAHPYFHNGISNYQTATNPHRRRNSTRNNSIVMTIASVFTGGGNHTGGGTTVGAGGGGSGHNGSTVATSTHGIGSEGTHPPSLPVLSPIPRSSSFHFLDDYFPAGPTMPSSGAAGADCDAASITATATTTDDLDQDWDIEAAVERRLVQMMFTVPRTKLRVVNVDNELESDKDDDHGDDNDRGGADYSKNGGNAKPCNDRDQECGKENIPNGGVGTYSERRDTVSVKDGQSAELKMSGRRTPSGASAELKSSSTPSSGTKPRSRNRESVAARGSGPPPLRPPPPPPPHHHHHSVVPHPHIPISRPPSASNSITTSGSISTGSEDAIAIAISDPR